MKGCVALCFLIGLFAQATMAGPLSVRNGNICMVGSSGEIKELTSSGDDSQPVLSPDGHWVVFVRTLPGKTIATGNGDSPATELWQIGVDGKHATLLVRPRSSDKMENVLANLSKPQFSSDGRRVFFVSDAFATSGAVHVVDTTNGKEHFVCGGSDVEVIRSGEYRDCLLVAQHRYFIGGGSYDWYFLLHADGKEIGPVGEDTENFKATYAPGQ
jgi:dipeptidyl aminopeptidase/acylaminoacyl peptidase